MGRRRRVHLGEIDPEYPLVAMRACFVRTTPAGVSADDPERSSSIRRSGVCPWTRVPASLVAPGNPRWGAAGQSPPWLRISTLPRYCSEATSSEIRRSRATISSSPGRSSLMSSARRLSPSRCRWVQAAAILPERWKLQSIPSASMVFSGNRPRKGSGPITGTNFDCNIRQLWYLRPTPDGGVWAPAEIHRMHCANKIGFAPTRTGVGDWRCCMARGVHVGDPCAP